MLASFSHSAAFIGLLFLCASALASDALIDSPQMAINESNLEDRVRQLENEVATLSQSNSPAHVGTDPCACCCAGPGFFASATWINWHVRQREPFQMTRVYFDFRTPDVRDPLEFNSANGIKTSLGYQFVDGWQLAFAYSYLRPHGQQQFSTPQPDGELFREFEDIDLKYDVFDMQFCLPWSIREGCDVSLFGGVRWAHIDQGRSAKIEVFDAGQLVASGQDILRANTNAAGIRIGGTASWQCYSGLSIFGSAAGAVLIQESTRTFATSSTSEGDLSDSDLSIDGLPVLETAAGISWSHGCLSIKAGYELATWFNMTEVTRVPFSGIPNQTRTLTFDGVFLELTILL